MNFAVLWLFAKFLHKIWGRSIYGTVKASNSQVLSLQKSYFSSIHESFLSQGILHPRRLAPPLNFSLGKWALPQEIWLPPMW